MSTSGYSGTPLLNKLGIKPAMKVLLVNQPDNYFDLLENNIGKQVCSKNEIPDFIHFFAKNQKEFEQEMKLIKSIAKKIRKLSSGFHGIKRVQRFLPILLKMI